MYLSRKLKEDADLSGFEEALNDEAPDLLDECFWIIRGFQTGIYDAMIFDEDIYRNGYVKYLMENIECEEKEAIFIVAVFETVITEISYYFEITKKGKSIMTSL